MTIPPLPDVLIISGLPVDNEDNRQRYANIGLNEIEWPPAYKNSVESVCQNCNAAMWMGPESHRTYLDLIARGGSPLVVCLVCCTMLARDGADVSVIQLTDKDSRKGE
jgi:hypothetical protein